MNVRIGNDVRVEIPLSTFGNIDEKDIVRMRCLFLKNDKYEDVFEDLPVSVFHHSSQYSVHGCGMPAYNTTPCLKTCCCSHQRPHDCGHIVCMQHAFVAECRIENNNIVTVFPAEAQCKGKYDCIFDLKVHEFNWDKNNIHSYRKQFYDVVDMDCNEDSLSGYIVITPADNLYNS